MGLTLTGILANARSALQVHQAATQTTAHNISNATTEGYSRQRAIVAPGSPLVTPQGVFGTGIRTAQVIRYRDATLDATFRRESAAESGARMRHGVLSQVEAALMEPGEQGLSATLDAFWASWSDLANNPTSGSAREAVRGRGLQLTEHMHRLDAALDRASQMADDQLSDAVERLNTMAAEVAELNRRIAAAESGGGTAGDLRDSRDRLLDAMATLADVKVIHRDNGAVGVTVASATLVDGANASTLSLERSGGTWSLKRGSATLGEPGGAAGAALTLLNTELPAFRDQLDTLARGVVSTVNALHAAGVAPAAALGTNFFDVPAGGVADVDAGSIALSADVEADALAIVAGYGDASDAYQAGNNELALALSRLRDAPDAVYLDGRTAGEYYAGAVTSLGLDVADAEQAVRTRELLASHAEAQRSSVSGVSTDEELVRLIEHQTAYSAAARVVNAVDEMLESVLGMV